MSEIRFNGTAHRDFFLENMNKCSVNDSYHRAFFYVMGIASETRANINQMFDFKNDCINPDGMHGGWQTSGTVRVCRLAFNLWNSYTDMDSPQSFTPEDLFCCESRSGIPNIAGIFLHSENKMNGHDKKGEAHEKVSIYNLPGCRRVPFRYGGIFYLPHL